MDGFPVSFGVIDVVFEFVIEVVGREVDDAEGVCVVVMFVIEVVVLVPIEEFVLDDDVVTFAIAFDEIATEVDEVVIEVIRDEFV